VRHKQTAASNMTDAVRHKQTAASNMTDVAVTDQDPRPEEQISDRQQELLLIAVALHSNDLL